MPTRRRAFDVAARAAFLIVAAAPFLAAQADSRPDDVSDLLETLRAKRGVPGLAAGRIDGSVLTRFGVAGVRAMGSPERIGPDDRFHLGSCTKAMTATLCAALVEDGLLGWSSSLKDVLGAELGAGIPEAWGGVTLEQLLTNTSGVPTDLSAHGLWGELWNFEGAPKDARRRLLTGVLKDPPKHAPGTTFEYSNGGFAIAGHLAEVAARRPFEDLLRERLFAPLGMTSAGYGPPGSADVVDHPRGHDGAGKALVPGRGADNPEAITPAGRVHCTLADWAKFLALHLAGARGEATLLKPATFAKLHARGPAKGSDYAMGWVVAERPWAAGRVLTHSGSNNLWFCVAWLAPERNFAVFAACNAAGAAGSRATDDAVAALLAPPRPISRPASRAAPR